MIKSESNFPEYKSKLHKRAVIVNISFTEDTKDNFILFQLEICLPLSIVIALRSKTLTLLLSADKSHRADDMILDSGSNRFQVCQRYRQLKLVFSVLIAEKVAH